VADYPALADAVESVASLLREHVTNSGEPVIAGIQIDLRSPRELELATTTDVVSVWLYHLEVQPDQRNAPAERVAPDVRRRPLPLDLYLLISPVHQDPRTAQILLGRIAQVVDDHARLPEASLSGSLAGTATALRLRLGAIPPTDVGSLWLGLQTNRRPGLVVMVQGLTVDSHLAPTQPPVVLSESGRYAQIVAVG
jgi:hypothetical protein